MTLPPTPNQSSPSTMKEGDKGWPVYGLQQILSDHGDDLELDGIFGGATEQKVSEAQKRLRLTVDGIAGPNTQRALCIELSSEVHLLGLPEGLVRSLIEGESGYYLGAVNWSIKGGVDCGVVQRRVFGPPFSVEKMEDAYDPRESVMVAIREIDDRAEAMHAFPAVKRRKDHLEYSMRLGLLAHNWPWAAHELALGRELSTSKRATWVPVGTRFPDGAQVLTYAHWAQFYALGGRHGEAKMTKYVKRWPS